MLVWDTSLNRFSEFGSNQEIAKAAREGLDSERQIYVLLSTSVHGPKTYLTVKVLLSFGSCAVIFWQLCCILLGSWDVKIISSSRVLFSLK
uniref:Uncharacterized protein n=1 Tax=Kalanchoe fedtschenkoi TaxID=63787 RepID=A0A7N0TSW4_KALFE